MIEERKDSSKRGGILHFCFITSIRKLYWTLVDSLQNRGSLGWIGEKPQIQYYMYNETKGINLHVSVSANHMSL